MLGDIFGDGDTPLAQRRGSFALSNNVQLHLAAQKKIPLFATAL